MNHEISRRRFLARTSRASLGSLAAGASLTALLAACGDDDDDSPAGSTNATSAGATTTAGSGSLQAVSIQLPWVKDAESAGEFIADDQGYFAAEGIQATLEAGGADIAVEPLIQAGRSIIGLTTPIFTANAVNEGADLVIIGAKFQKNPFAITSLASAPIKTPQEMAGKKIGVGAINEAIWSAFLSVNGIDPGSVTKVPVQFDPTPLAAGEVDGWLSFYTTEPIILKYQGIETYTFSMGDFNLVTYGDVFICKSEVLADPDQLNLAARIMRAEQKGWQASIDDPALGARLAAETYGRDLNLDVAQQTDQCQLQAELIVSPTTQANGLFYMSDIDIQGNLASMQASDTAASASLFSQRGARRDLWARLRSS